MTTEVRAVKAHCKGCSEFSVDVGLIYAGKGMGYIKLCSRCATGLREGKLMIVKDPDDGRLDVMTRRGYE